MFTSHTRRGVLATAAALALASPWQAALAQAGPSKPVNIVVPFPAGGGTDAFARPLFATMTKNTGKQFVIDNKGSAGGTVGANQPNLWGPDFGRFVGSEIKRWAEVVKGSGAKMD